MVTVKAHVIQGLIVFVIAAAIAIWHLCRTEVIDNFESMIADGVQRDDADIVRALLGDTSINQSYCSQDTRISNYKGICKHMITMNAEPRLAYVILDHDKKTLGCLISKAGSKSWLRYIVRTKYSKFTGGLERQNAFLKQYNLETVKRLTTANVSKLYDSWTKYIVVRHPLQRLVSGYYEAIVGRHRYMTGNNTPITFEEFADRMNSGEIVNKNGHWSFYKDRCSVCSMYYDFVVKQETIDVDVELFNKLIGIPPNISPELMHQNPQLTSDDKYQHNYKYDSMLSAYQQEHPETMRGLLGLYGDDMELFGYEWDWGLKKSSCKTNASNDESCC